MDAQSDSDVAQTTDVTDITDITDKIDATEAPPDVVDPEDAPSIPDPGKPGPGCDPIASPCAVGELCVDGDCVDACSSVAAAWSGVGCRYLAVDLENVGGSGPLPSAEDSSFAVTLTNPSSTEPVSVTVHDGVGQPPLSGYEFDIPPGGQQVVPLGIKNIKGTLKAKLAWEIKGTGPFEAFQINPLNAFAPTFSNDLSKLYPLTKKSTEFLAITGRHNAFVTVVAGEDDTTVSVSPSGDVSAGGGIGAMSAGQLYTVTLDGGDVLNLRGASPDTDLTGTLVLTTKPVAVFGGSVLSRTGPACCADHLEQQLPPLATWGSTIVATRSTARGQAPDYWRVIAGEDDTTVTFDPPVSVPAQLDRGEWIEFNAGANFVVDADGPVMLVQLLASAHEVTPHGAYCTTDKDCPTGQQCVGAAGDAGRCFPSCKVQKDDCPSDVFTCHDRSGDLPGYVYGEGICFRNTCGPSDGPCPVGAVCVDGDAAAICYEPCTTDTGCEEAGATCSLLQSQTVCSPAGCTAEEPACPGEATCQLPAAGEDGSAFCQYECTPANGCANPAYRCLSSKLYPPEAKWFDGDICVPPVCTSHKDCPAGHLCNITADAEGPFVCKPIGDPSMVLMSPAEQWQRSVMAIVPKGYGHNYLTVAAPAAAAVQLNGLPVQPNDFTEVGQAFKVIRIQVTAGVYRVTATQPVGVGVHGFDDEVSYGTSCGGRLVALSDQVIVGPGPDGDPDAGDTGDGSEVEVLEDVDIGPTVPTWDEHVHPLMKNRCAPCHIDGGDSGSANFDDYANILVESTQCGAGVLLGEAIVLKVKNPNPCEGGAMPPTGLTLSVSEIQLLEAWLVAGMPEVAP